MTAPVKPEFPPLLPPGRHEMSMLELRTLCVDRFPSSEERPVLFAALTKLRKDLDSLVGRYLFWIDGSFITEKIDPNDIDLSVAIEDEVLCELSKDVKDWLKHKIRQKYYHPKLHTFPLVIYARGHHDFRRSIVEDRYWSQWWSVSRDGWLRGLPVVRAGEGDVGVRILRRTRA